MVRAYLLLVAFGSGMAVLGVELTASRLVAPHFGTSLVVWANLIGLTLLYLTLGYVVGGRLADARPEPRLLYLIVLAAGAGTLLLPFAGPPFLGAMLGLSAGLPAGLLLGSLVGLLLLLAVPVGLMGMVSPFVIRLLMEEVERAGNVAGGVYAVSTLGSMLGAVLPVLWMIPVWGTRSTFLSFGALLVGLGVVGLALGRGRRLWAVES